MATQKPSIPKGTRDFTPVEMARRNYIFDAIRAVFLLYGYQPIETPAMENLSTLMGKYGEEGDKLLFRILNSGNYLEKVRRSEGQEVIGKGTELRAQGSGLRVRSWQWAVESIRLLIYSTNLRKRPPLRPYCPTCPICCAASA